MISTYEDVQSSYGRCLRQKGFISRFYELLLECDERIRRAFTSTDWTKQNRALRRGISIALTYAGGSRIVERSMREMADVHSRRGRVPIEPELYMYWRESLLQAVREFDESLNPALENHWAEALRKTTDYFIQRY